MKFSLRVFLSLAIAAVIGIPPLLAARSGRADAQTTTEPQRQVTPFDRGGQSERQAPDASAPEPPARRVGEPRITPFCEPVPEKFFISSLGSIATDLGTAGYLIDRPGRYVVTRDLIVPAVDFGILIRAHNVILDLEGHKISDRADRAVLVRTDGELDVTIRGGSLEGGIAGIVAVAPRNFSERGRLTLRRLRVRTTAATSYAAVDLREMGHVEIHGIEVVGGLRGVSLGGTSLDSRIVDSRITARQEGLRIDGFDAGLLQGNEIEAPDAVVIGGGGSHVVGNRIVGGFSGSAALRIANGSHFIRDNEIQAGGGAHAAVLSGMSITRRNQFSGGSESTVALRGDQTRLAENVIEAETIGVASSGARSFIEENQIHGGALQCGILFENAYDHAYRRNTIQGAATPICGVPNLDAGGNESSVCAADDCGLSGRRAGVGSPRGRLAFEDEGPEPRIEPARKCEPGELVLIDAPRGTHPDDWGLRIDAPGYYLVTRDLDLRAFRYGVLITSNNVTLDLGGHTLNTGGERAGRILGGENVIIRDGQVLGSYSGLTVLGDPNSNATAVRLEWVRFARGTSSGYSGLSIKSVRYVELLGSVFGGRSSSAGIGGPGTAHIIGNRIDATESGLRLGLDNSVILGNWFYGDVSLSFGSETSVTRNVMDSAQALGSDNIFEENVVYTLNDKTTGFGGDRNFVRHNIMSRRVGVSGTGSRFENNLLLDGVSISGSGNRVDGLFVSGGKCGLNFVNDAQHQYRDNVVVRAREGLCGSLNLDGGGNVFPPPVCGNEVLATSELCEHGASWDLSCRQFGYQRGGVQCNESCDALDMSGCSTCGDDVLGDGEACDGSALNGKSCQSEGFGQGTLSCLASCEGFDYSQCFSGCGNGILEEGEFCDGAQVGEMTCGALGFQGGNLRCNATCSFYDPTTCTGGCGNGIAEGSEDCDGMDHNDECHHMIYIGCGCDQFGLGSERVGCTSACKFDFSTCSGYKP